MKKNLIVGLGSLYKTNYSTSDGHIQLEPEQVLPLKYIKTSHLNE